MVRFLAHILRVDDLEDFSKLMVPWVEMINLPREELKRRTSTFNRVRTAVVDTGYRMLFPADTFYITVNPREGSSQKLDFVDSRKITLEGKSCVFCNSQSLKFCDVASASTSMNVVVFQY